MLLRIAVLIGLILSHGPLVQRLVRKLRRSDLPTTRELVIVSFLLYYDMGFALEAAGIPYVNSYFLPVFCASDAALTFSVLVVLVSPWLIELAAGCWQPGTPVASQHSCRLLPRRRLAFYACTSAVCIGSMWAAWRYSLGSSQIWVSRALLGSSLGPYILILFMPLYLLAFYVRLQDSHTAFGRMFLAFLTLSAVATTLPIGERTYILLPFVIVSLFWFRFSLRTLVMVTATSFLGAVMLLPFFKWQTESNSSLFDLAADTLNGDFARAPVLADVFEQSALAGTRVMRYAGEGYVYSALYFVPRGVAPFKGDSSQTMYTAYAVSSAPENLDWGLGISAIDELLLNFGVLLLPLGLLAYGMGIGYADRLSDRVSPLEVPTRLSAVFFLGYHLPAMLQSYGGMALTILIAHKLFARTAISAARERT